MKFMLDRRVSTFMHVLGEKEMETIQNVQIKGATSSHALVRYELGKTYEHEEQLSAITISPSSGEIASADVTGLIKIWNKHK